MKQRTGGQLSARGELGGWLKKVKELRKKKPYRDRRQCVDYLRERRVGEVGEGKAGNKW